MLLVVPAIAAVFFDFIVGAYNFSIKRAGHFIRHNLEPQFRNDFAYAEDKMLWEEFMATDIARIGRWYEGNLGITFLAMVAAFFGLFSDFHIVFSPALGAVLLVAFYASYKSMRERSRFREPAS